LSSIVEVSAFTDEIGFNALQQTSIEVNRILKMLFEKQFVTLQHDARIYFVTHAWRNQTKRLGFSNPSS